MTTTTEAATSAATKAEVDAGAEAEAEEEVEEAAEAEEEEAVVVAEAIKALSPTTWATTETDKASDPAKAQRSTMNFSKETYQRF
jgi:hypothetical protein